MNYLKYMLLCVTSIVALNMEAMATNTRGFTIKIVFKNSSQFDLEFIDQLNNRTIIPAGSSGLVRVNAQVPDLAFIQVLKRDLETQQYKSARILKLLFNFDLFNSRFGMIISGASTGDIIAQGSIPYTFGDPYPVEAKIELSGATIDNLFGTITLTPTGKGEIA